jgi:hypothetical protein
MNIAYKAFLLLDLLSPVSITRPLDFRDLFQLAGQRPERGTFAQHFGRRGIRAFQLGVFAQALSIKRRITTPITGLY